MVIQNRTEVTAPRGRLDIADELVVVENRMKTNSELVSALSRKFRSPDAETRKLLDVRLTPLLNQMKDDMVLYKAQKYEWSNAAA